MRLSTPISPSCCPSLGAKLLLELGAREQEVDWRGGRIGRPFPVQTDLSLFPPLPVPSIWKQDKTSRISWIGMFQTQKCFYWLKVKVRLLKICHSWGEFWIGFWFMPAAPYWACTSMQEKSMFGHLLSQGSHELLIYDRNCYRSLYEWLNHYPLYRSYTSFYVSCLGVILISVMYILHFRVFPLCMLCSPGHSYLGAQLWKMSPTFLILRKAFCPVDSSQNPDIKLKSATGCVMAGMSILLA